MDAGIGFTQLLAHAEAEHSRWKQFFAQHPKALDVPCDVAESGTVRELMFHVFVVNLYFAHLLLGLERPDLKGLPHGSLEELFRVGDDAAGKLRQFLERARPEEWNQILPLGFGDYKVSKRKMMAQAILHGVQHRAQLATLLRQRGFKQDWIHDLIVSGVME